MIWTCVNSDGFAVGYDNFTEIWNYMIGGSQPLLKWLKDRKGMVLSETEILHYMQIIAIIKETISIMEEIDSIISI